MDLASWAGSVNLDTPAGRLLSKLSAGLPQDRHFAITVFGSAPLQLLIDAAFTSAGVDLFSDTEELETLVERAGLGEGQAALFIQVASELNFRTSPRWRTRTQSAHIGNCTFYFPHPIDILIAKLLRLEEKDLSAFHTVIAKTSHPTDAELLHELQMAVDLFRPGFDEGGSYDLATNCRRLWPIAFGREIDPSREIIAPALQKRREGYGEPGRDHKQELRDAVAAYRVGASARKN